jgi:hypothetical protein
MNKLFKSPREPLEGGFPHPSKATSLGEVSLSPVNTQGRKVLQQFYVSKTMQDFFQEGEERFFGYINIVLETWIHKHLFLETWTMRHSNKLHSRQCTWSSFLLILFFFKS